MSGRKRFIEPSKGIRLTAKIGISCQFAALVRILAELIWLHGRGAVEPTSARAGIFALGAMVAAAFCWVSVMSLWFNRVRLSIAVATATILLLLAIKLWAVHAGLL